MDLAEPLLLSARGSAQLTPGQRRRVAADLAVQQADAADPLQVEYGGINVIGLEGLRRFGA